MTVNWGDGTTDNLAGTATSDTHVYASAGNVETQTFTPVVTATNVAGSGSTATKIAVNDQPPTVTLKGLSPNPTNPGEIVTATFSTTDNDGTVAPISVIWGDGTAVDTIGATATSDTHSYSSPGSYAITITVTDNSGSTAQETGSVTVQTPIPVNTGTSVSLTFAVTNSTTVTGITVNWGDGTSQDILAGTATSGSHVYAATGTLQSQTYTITVSATNAGGSGSGTTTETVKDRPPMVVVSSVSPNPTSTGRTVTANFTSTDSDGTIASITVNWGDGTAVDNLAGTATSDSHSYSTAGNYTISLVATDNGGSTGSATTALSVRPASTIPYALSVTADGKVYKTYSNGTMVFVGQPVTTQLREVSWKPDGSYALISGDSAVLLKYDGTQLTSMPTGISTGYNFWTVSWKPDGSYALIGGTSGLLLKYDGISITTIKDQNTLTIFAISWSPTGSYALIVGKGGVTLTYDGTAIRFFTSGTSYDLDAIGWNPSGQYALIGGLNGTVLRFNGTQLGIVNTSGLTGTNGIRSLAFNPSGTLALLVGDNGMVLAYNGSILTRIAQVTFSWLYAVSWSPSGTAYIVGNGGTELTYSNGTLAKATGGITSSLRAIAWKPQ